MPWLRALIVVLSLTAGALAFTPPVEAGPRKEARASKQEARYRKRETRRLVELTEAYWRAVRWGDPGFIEEINRYQPDVFWTDGDWDPPADLWKSQQFLTWLYNESVVKDKVVVNDRWGAGIRFKHGGIFTPEYQPDLDFENHAWEESRGMGFSYGYNREEDAWDYNSTQSLILQLIDKVSRGGNFLLDIGPDEHGKIPPIMQERLIEMGKTGEEAQRIRQTFLVNGYTDQNVFNTTPDHSKFKPWRSGENVNIENVVFTRLP